ncbi:uncharacterized protein LOC131675388 [Phymastichus coffea]|uniref:uncharacterized protein LOC131675388 n=1 Tax=Phymastichus coffea TaxID=108790 RepID=UPI00273CBCAE|nr:uncharacterized protein LOC131675388 [Phymastichus coffea]
MQDQRRDKGEDKPVAGAHREYLDEEFSSEDEAPEEKRERRDGRRAQLDQFSGNSPRATYSQKELDKLVDRVKKLTTLGGLRDEHWNDDCLAVVREFVGNSGAAILTLFFGSDSELRARLSVPDEPVRELAYFSRKPGQLLRPDGLSDQLLFGTINGNVELAILILLRDVIFPVCRTGSASWSDSMHCSCKFLNR